MEQILFCRCANADIIPQETVREILEGLSFLHARYIVTSDLCEMVASRDPILRELTAEGVTVIACHSRVVQWLLFAGKAEPIPEKVNVLDMRIMSAASILDSVENRISVPEGNHVNLTQDTGDWAPWFPVIDYSRCKNCKQCLDFCLFGVYELSVEGGVTVVNPRNCKNNCPACARICPEVAIIFPKLHEEPLNGGEIEDESAVKAMIRINTEKILGDDVYAALAERKRKREELLLEHEQKQAEKERTACSNDVRRTIERQ